MNFIKLENAIKLASKYHEWQFRRDGTPYIAHPLAVMDTLKQRDFPEDALVAAVLHDICEDTSLNLIDINSMFWHRVWFIVNALSKNKKPKNNKQLKEEYERQQKEKKITNLENYQNFDEYVDYRFHLYLNRFYTWIIAEPWIFFIKIADQIHNISDMTPFTNKKRQRKIYEIEKYFLPIYEKCADIFNMDINSTKEYKYFIGLLINEIEKSKIKYNL